MFTILVGQINNSETLVEGCGSEPRLLLFFSPDFRQMKLSWVHSTAIGAVTPALAAPMHFALRVKICPPFLEVFTPNAL